MAERTVERLAEGLPWERDEVVGLHSAVVAALRGRGMAPQEAVDVAYSGVMATGSVFAAVGEACPPLSAVMTVIDRGGRLVTSVEGRN